MRGRERPKQTHKMKRQEKAKVEITRGERRRERDEKKNESH